MKCNGGGNGASGSSKSISESESESESSEKMREQFLPESKINKGEQGWKPTQILSTNRAVPKGLIQRVLFGTSVEIVAFSNIQQATTYLSSSIATLVFMDNIFPSNTTGLEASPNTKSCTKFACIACAQ